MTADEGVPPHEHAQRQGYGGRQQQPGAKPQHARTDMLGHVQVGKDVPKSDRDNGWSWNQRLGHKSQSWNGLPNNQ